MKAIYRALGVLVVLGAVFGAYVSESSKSLPERVATHFGADGTPNGWMSRSSHVRFMLSFGLGIPTIVFLLSWFTRFLPREFINIPRRDYWLAPEREAATREFVSGRVAWLSCLLMVFFGGVQHSIVEANRDVPARLSTPVLLTMVGGFLAALLFWIFGFVTKFRSQPG